MPGWRCSPGRRTDSRDSWPAAPSSSSPGFTGGGATCCRSSARRPPATAGRRLRDAIPGPAQPAGTPPGHRAAGRRESPEDRPHRGDRRNAGRRHQALAQGLGAWITLPRHVLADRRPRRRPVPAGGHRHRRRARHAELQPRLEVHQRRPAGAGREPFDDAAGPSSPRRTPTTTSTPSTTGRSPGHRGEQNQWGGRTWYRKTFTAARGLEGQEGLHRVRRRAPGRRGLPQRQAARHRARPASSPSASTSRRTCKFGETERAGGDVRQPVHEGPDRRGRRPAGPTHAEPPAAPTSTSRPPPARAGRAHRQDDDEDPRGGREARRPTRSPGTTRTGIPRTAASIATSSSTSPIRCTSRCRCTASCRPPGRTSTRRTSPTRRRRSTVEVPVENGRAAARRVEVVAEVLDQRRQDASLTLAASAATSPAGAHEHVQAVAARSTTRSSGSRLSVPVPRRLHAAGRRRRRSTRVEVPLGIRTRASGTRRPASSSTASTLKLHGWGQKPTDEWPGLGAAQPDWLHFFTLRPDAARRAATSSAGATARAGPRRSPPAIGWASSPTSRASTAKPTPHGAAWKVRAGGVPRPDHLLPQQSVDPDLGRRQPEGHARARAGAARLHGQVRPARRPRLRASPRRQGHRPSSWTSASAPRAGARSRTCPSSKANTTARNRRAACGTTPRRRTSAIPRPRAMTYQLTSEQFAVNQVAHCVKKLRRGRPLRRRQLDLLRLHQRRARGRGSAPAPAARSTACACPRKRTTSARRCSATEPQVHIIGHWTYPAGHQEDRLRRRPTRDEVELFVNGKSLGRAQADRPLPVHVPRRRVRAGRDQGRRLSRTASSVADADQAARPGRPVGADAHADHRPRRPAGRRRRTSLLVDVEAVDAKGRRAAPRSSSASTSTLEGPGVWRGGYNSGKLDSINNTVPRPGSGHQPRRRPLDAAARRDHRARHQPRPRAGDR